MTRDEIQDCIDRVLDLHEHGVGGRDFRGMTAEERRIEWNHGRERLLAMGPKIERAREWLRKNATPIKTVTGAVGAGSIKQFADREIGWMPKGVYAVAAMSLGFAWRVDDRYSDLAIGVSHKSIKALRAQDQARRKSPVL